MAEPTNGVGGSSDPPFEVFRESDLERSVSERFSAIAERYSARLAVADLDRSLTYGELASLVEGIASSLAGVGDRPGPVAILLPTDLRFPAALLGVLAAGRFYLPLDPNHPLARNRAILEHAGAKIVLSAGALLKDAVALLGTSAGVVDVDTRSVRVGATRPAAPGDVAQIVYTSGSTGAPKGVCLDNRGLLYSVMQHINRSRIRCEDRIALSHPPTAGAAPAHLLSALLTGASLHVLPPPQLGPEGLAREMRDRGITVWHCVPSLFRGLARAIAPGERLDALRLLRIGGERIEWSDVEAFQRLCSPTARFVAGIASTETGSLFAHWDADLAVRETAARLPVGRTAENYAIRIVDDDGHPVASGEVGEIVVVSRYLARGYWNEPALTERYFGVDPEDPTRRTFASGDLGRLRPDGLLEYHGRKDERIKLRGHRVELGEVEAALRACDGVLDAGVVAKGQADSVRSLAAYVVIDPKATGLLPRHIASMVGRSLPDFMVPATITIVDALPRLAGHKLDRGAIAALDAEMVAKRVHHDGDTVVLQVAAAFERVLAVTDATPDDNLLTLGGNSFQAVALISEIERSFGIRVPSEKFAAARSIRELAEWIAAKRERGQQ